MPSAGSCAVFLSSEFLDLHKFCFSHYCSRPTGTNRAVNPVRFRTPTDPLPRAPANGRPGFPFGFLGAGGRLPQARRGRVFQKFNSSSSSPSFFAVASEAVPHFLRSVPNFLRTYSEAFRTSSALLPHFSALLPQRFLTSSSLLQHNCRNGRRRTSLCRLATVE